MDNEFSKYRIIILSTLDIHYCNFTFDTTPRDLVLLKIVVITYIYSQSSSYLTDVRF